MKNIRELVKDFAEFAELQDNSDAEMPNVRVGLEQFFGSELAFKIAQSYEWNDWDPLDDGSFLTPEFLGYILLAAKLYWESKEDNA